MKLETAIESAFKQGGKDILVETASVLRNSILDAFEKSDELRWPPSAEYMAKTDSAIPGDLEKFLMLVFFWQTN